MALAFFHRYCRPEFQKEIEGDFIERFSYYSKKYGQAKANSIFIKDVVLPISPKIIGNIYQLTNTETMIFTKQNKRLATIVATATALLFIPLLAMKVTSEVDWKFYDFLVAGTLLISTGLVLEFILRGIKTKTYRIIFGTILFLSLFLIWVELAVGIFGTIISGS